MKKRVKLAFSLLELSIVIIVIGVLVIGITKGSTIITAAKLKSARALTNGSPVHSIDKLELWLETTTAKSFNNSTKENGDAIATWYDIGKHSNPKNATQSTGDSQPTYTINAINGLPVLRFDGTDDNMEYDASNVSTQSQTVFSVTQRRSSAVYNIILGNNDGVWAKGLLLHYLFVEGTANLLSFQGYNGSTPLSTELTPNISTGIANEADNIKIYQNGTEYNSTSGYPGGISTVARIGKHGSYYYNGDIAEIIVFSKAVSDAQRQAVEDYLSKKWGIDIN